jgi:Protein of unknown function (DUF1073)
MAKEPALRANLNQDDLTNQNVLSNLMQRVRLWLTGMQYGGARDMYAVLGYYRTLQQQDYVGRYLRQDIAKRIIDQPVLSTWADPPEIQADPAFMTAWQNLTNPIESGPAIWQSLMRLDKLAGLGQFAGLVFGFDDGQNLSTPVRQQSGRKILYLQPYAETAVRVKSYDENKASPRFGLPVIYTVAPGRFRPELRTGNAGFTYTSETGRRQFDCHYSRFLHVAEGLLEDSVYGRSRLEAVNNLLDDVLKISGGGAEAFWLLANRGMQVDVDKEMDLSPEDQQMLQKEIEDYQHEMRRFIRTRGVTINPLATQANDPTGQFGVALSLLSATTGQPQSILTGSARGEQVSQQDRAAWSERVSERVAEYAEPIILRPFIYTCVNAGVLPKPKSLVISWPDAFKLSPLEKSQTSAQMARSAANLTKSQANTPEDGAPLFTNQEARKIVSFGKKMPVFEGDQANASGVGNANNTSLEPDQSSDGSVETSGSDPSGGSPAMPGAQPDPMFGTGEQEG